MLQSEAKVLIESKSKTENKALSPKPKFQTTIYLKEPKKLLGKKLKRSQIKKIFVTSKKSDKKTNDGRWTLKEHIQFLQIIVKYGIKWRKIKGKILTRNAYQIRSHAQKFYQKLKLFKDEELGIDFTKDNIKNLKDMINHIKNINSNYNIVNIFLYISEKIKAIKENKKNKKYKPKRKINLDNININIGKNSNTGTNIISNNINTKGNNINNILNLLQPINNINNNQNNNILVKNLNFINNYNIYDPLLNSLLYNNIIMNIINNTNNILFNHMQNINLNNYRIDNSNKDLFNSHQPLTNINIFGNGNFEK